ncbi:MAG: hypothetical protein K6F68_06640 [Clostridiales bacterium]|nr:hypothetical protein [Clostridiales bacterium]
MLVNEKGENGPITVTFNEDGTYRYGYDTKLQSDPGPVSDAVNTFINSSVLKDIASETGLTSLLKSESAQKFLSEISKAAELKYKIIDDSTMETKVSLLFGFLDHTSEVSYSLNGDELVFDGVQYRRVTED